MSSEYGIDSWDRWERVTVILRNPEGQDPPLNELDTDLRLTVMPSFQVPKVWILQKPVDGRCRIRRVEVDSALAPHKDWDGVRIFTADGYLTADVATNFTEALNSLNIPPFLMRDRDIVLDGSSRTIEVPGGTSITWRNTAPPEWEALQSWFEETTSILDANLPASSLEKYRKETLG